MCANFHCSTTNDLTSSRKVVNSIWLVMGSKGFLWLAGLILCIVTADTRSDTWGRGTATTPASSPAAAFCHLGRVSLRSAQAPQSRRQAVCRIPLVMSDSPATRSEETLEADFAHIPTRESSVERIPKGLKNRYFALRHGQSEANVENIISSLPARGTTIHGLTQLGREQARGEAAASLCLSLSLSLCLSLSKFRCGGLRG